MSTNSITKRKARALVLLALVLLVGGCAREPLPIASGSSNYELRVFMTEIPLPDGTIGTRMSIEVRPPDPSDATQRAQAKALEQEFLRRMQAHDLPR